MTRSEKIMVTCAAAYALGFILTFGYASNRNYREDAVPAQNEFDGLACAFFWPLYLSYVAFESARPPKHVPQVEAIGQGGGG